MRLLRFRCKGCALEMALPERPDKCFCCGSSDIVREGWRQQFRNISGNQRMKERDKR